MFESEKKLSLSDLIDVKLLQEFQDTFAKAMNVASITVDNKGPITRPSNFTDFCTKYTRNSELGMKRCVDCDIKWGKIAASRGEPVTYTCHTGLTDFAVPIVVDGNHLGSILGGQVLTEPPNEAHFRKIAKELNIDEDEYIEALKKIKIVPMENVKAAAHLLFLVANAISEIGHKNLELFKKNKCEGLYRIIMGTIRATLDIEETKKRIVNIIGQTLGADRCFITEFDKKTDKFLIINDEYLSSNDIFTLKGVDINIEVPNFAATIKKGKSVIVNNKKISHEKDDKKFDTEKAALEKYNVKSSFAFPLYYSDELLGALAIHYVNKDHLITDEEINLISTVANQIIIAIHQSKLYHELKQTAAYQDAILNNMPFMAWLKDDKSRLLAVNDAFAKMCNTTVEHLKGKTDFDYFPQEHAELYIKEDKLVMETQKTIPTVDLISGPEGVRWHETFKSPVYDEKGNVVGTVGMARDITERKEIELELLRKQEELAKVAEREKALRMIMSSSAGSFDLNEVIKSIIEQAGKLFKADRCFFIEFDAETNSPMPIYDYAEYLSSNDIRSHITRQPTKTETEAFISITKQKKIAFVEDIDKVDLPKSSRKMLVDDLSVKSYLIMPVFYGDIAYGSLILHYVHDYMQFTDDFIEVAQAIANQSAIVIHQSKLYAHAQSSALSKGEFIANMTHEIKTPLNVIIGFSEILSESQLDYNKQVEYLKNINKSGKHLLDLTNDIINISKIESGNFKLNYENINSEQLILEVASSLKLIADGKNISLDIDTINARVKGDRKMLTQILYNLLNNAIKFTPENGSVRIKSGFDKGRLIVSVEDTGIGIEVDHQDTIFEKYKQVDSSYARKQQGAGLGLSIAKKLIELHNGSIHVESVKNKGSRFWFALPKSSTVNCEANKK